MSGGSSSHGRPLRITAPQTITATAPSGVTSMVVTYPAATVTGGKSPYTILYSPASGSTFALGASTVTIHVTDAKGATATTTFSVIVLSGSLLPPPLVLEVPPTQTVTSPDNQPVAVTYNSPQASGGVPPYTLVSTPASGSLFSVGTTTVLCTVTDSGGANTAASFFVVVNAAPVVVPPPDNPPPPDPTPSTIVDVAVDGDIQAAIDAALPGTLIRVAPGDYDGIVLKAKTGTAPIVIQTSGTLPAAGVRIDPSYADALVKLTSLDSSVPPVSTESGASNYILRGLYTQPGLVTTAQIALGSDVEPDPLNQPNNITIDQCLLLGSESVGGIRGIAANTRNLLITNSWIAGFWYTADAQAILGWNGPGPFLIQNNRLESSGENVMFGGGDPANINMQPQHITIRKNYLTKPITWLDPGQPGATIKNVLELKDALHVLIEGNVLEHSWTSGQVGFLMVVTPRNQDGTAPFSGVQDVTVQYNVIKHGAGGVNVLGQDDRMGIESLRLIGLRIVNNLFFDVNPSVWPGVGRLMQLLNGPQQVEIGHNTILGENLSQWILLGSFGDVNQCDGLNIHDNIACEGYYGIFGDNDGQGRAALNSYAPSAVCTNNLILRGPSGLDYNYGPQTNTVTVQIVTDPTTIVPADTMKPIEPYASLPTTDGAVIGCNIDVLLTQVNASDNPFS